MARKVWEFQPTGRWVRAVKNGITIADSDRPVLMIESRGELDYYFPEADVRMDLLAESGHIETSGYRGVKKFWHLKVGDQVIDNAAWAYEPKEDRPDFTGYIAFKWRAMDHWYEEEEEVFGHPRHPYHRVDTISSSRHVEVFVDGIKIADTVRPFLLFETGLPTRYYIPEEDVKKEHLLPSDAHSVCPYKGKASYYSVRVNGDELENVVWYYPNPIPEAPKLKGLVAFWPEKDKKRIQIRVNDQVV